MAMRIRLLRRPVPAIHHHFFSRSFTASLPASTVGDAVNSVCRIEISRPCVILHRHIAFSLFHRWCLLGVVDRSRSSRGHRLNLIAWRHSGHVCSRRSTACTIGKPQRQSKTFRLVDRTRYWPDFAPHTAQLTIRQAPLRDVDAAECFLTDGHGRTGNQPHGAPARYVSADLPAMSSGVNSDSYDPACVVCR